MSVSSNSGHRGILAVVAPVPLCLLLFSASSLLQGRAIDGQRVCFTLTQVFPAGLAVMLIPNITYTVIMEPLAIRQVRLPTQLIISSAIGGTYGYVLAELFMKTYRLTKFGALTGAILGFVLWKLRDTEVPSWPKSPAESHKG
ncbi:MAG: hypothetical protein ACI9EF_002182 [Pseudohongiellaceae bacterium]|jgi:hypothetical protein